MLSEYNRGLNADLRNAIQAVYREAQHRAEQPGSFILLTLVFDSTPEPIYLDEVHTGPLGNRLIADEIARILVSSGALTPDSHPSRSSDRTLQWAALGCATLA